MYVPNTLEELCLVKTQLVGFSEMANQTWHWVERCFEPSRCKASRLLTGHCLLTVYRLTWANRQLIDTPRSSGNCNNQLQLVEIMGPVGQGRQWGPN